jgi:hypothetical protein
MTKNLFIVLILIIVSISLAAIYLPYQPSKDTNDCTSRYRNSAYVYAQYYKTHGFGGLTQGQASSTLFFSPITNGCVLLIHQTAENGFTGGFSVYWILDASTGKELILQPEQGKEILGR